MRNDVIVAAAVVTTIGLLAITATLLLRPVSERSTEKTRDLQRWEDDGGSPPAHATSEEGHSA
jgi:hypothetical protein